MAKTVGFVGLGNMGGHMARNLANAGYKLKVFDLVADLMASVPGAQACDSANAAVSEVDVVISMLPAGRHVSGLYLGDDGLLSACAPNTLLIDCSTIDPETSRRVAAEAAKQQLIMLDAPVSGGTGGAEQGTLTFMVGGDTQGLEQARPLLDVMGANVFHAGDSGAGQIVKVCNNMLLAIHMAGTAEAISLGVRNGLDPGVLSEVMKQSSGGNWSLNVYNPYPNVMEGVPSSRGYTGGFLVDLMLKDLGLAMETAAQSGNSVPMGSLAKNLFNLHKQTGDAGGYDFSSIAWLYDPQLREK